MNNLDRKPGSHAAPGTLNTHRAWTKRLFGCIGASLLLASGLYAQSSNSTVTPFLPAAVQVVSTVPPNGDVNPYGVAFVPAGFPAGGRVNPGDILVSNFNNKQNLQGTGTTIVDITPTGQKSVFFKGQPGLGLSTALKVLGNGYVIVGNLPTSDGTCATAGAGSLIILDKNGNVVTTLVDSQLIDGPWDMTVNEAGNSVQAFISNALSGTVSRYNLLFGPGGPTVQSATIIASGYQHRCDPAALVVGPTGMVYNLAKDLLYVASTEDNAVFAVPNAGSSTGDHGIGTIVYQDNTHLHGPLGMSTAPNGDLLVTNSDVINSDPNQPSEIVEFTTAGAFVKQISVDPAQGGSFGIRVGLSGQVARLAAVNDNQATLVIWTIPIS